MPGNNGIARSQNGTIYVGSAKIGGISTFEEQRDHSLVLTDVIPTGKSVAETIHWSPTDPTPYAYRSHRGQSLRR